MDGFAGVYPEHKFAIVEALQSRGRLIGMTGAPRHRAAALRCAARRQVKHARLGGSGCSLCAPPPNRTPLPALPCLQATA